MKKPSIEFWFADIDRPYVWVVRPQPARRRTTWPSRPPATGPQRVSIDPAA